jgi:hypothetical protein
MSHHHWHRGGERLHYRRVIEFSAEQTELARLIPFIDEHGELQFWRFTAIDCGL